MFTSLPSTFIDGAEKVVPAPATGSAFQPDEPLTCQQNSSELSGP